MTRHILVIDTSYPRRVTTRTRLSAGCYSTAFADTAAEAQAAARTKRPDAILIDHPQAGDALAVLRRDMRLRDVPVLVSAQDDVRLPLLQAGATDVLPCGVGDAVLLARLRAVMRHRADDTPATGLAEDAQGFDQPATIAFIADRTDSTARLRGDLAPRLSDRITRITAEAAMTADTVPDLFVIESAHGGAAGGLRLMSELRAQCETRNIPICILDDGADAQAVAMAWDLGADEVVPASVGAAELALRIGSLVRMKQRNDRRRASVAQGLRMAMVDPLTGLHNRRFALPRLEAMAHGDIAILQIDLDRFKSVNDRWGHAAGDAVLRAVSERLTARLRPSDLAARIGGEEFLIALPDVQLAQAIEIADAICQRVAATPVHLPSGETLGVTVSIGLATRRRFGGETVIDTLDRADRALLQSKRSGRNRVTVASSPSEWTTCA